ncbi:MAG: hypothetical protein KF832_05910 [Caldilineaceae bacterium]|nr:hypothetical protein [Caldilineaceae bacterium]
MSTIEIGTRRELLVDDALIAASQGITRTLHAPTPRDIALVHDQPWEGNTSYYHTVFQDGDRFKMYYRGAHVDEQDGAAKHQTVCYAESRDGITWEKPELGIVEFQGSRRNNIVWDGIGAHTFVPFRDHNPASPPEAAYKAIAAHQKALYAFQSADGLHWSPLQEEPVITEGAFDSQNLAFWDPQRGCYVDFHRQFQVMDGERVRDIMTCTSSDFRQWTKPVFLDFGDAPIEHLYTNQISPYYRAPHLYLGFPKRFAPRRQTSYDRHTGISDVVFMSSRDGLHFTRWGEAWLRPGPQKERWVNRNNFVAWGIVETAATVPGVPNELSFYSMEGYYRGTSCQMRRYTLRLDGFVSANAPLAGGELVTKPLVFTGKQLTINAATSAVGSVRVELQDAAGQPVPGFTLADADEFFGDAIAQTVTWQGQADLTALAGKPIRIRFVLADADLYAFQTV